MSEGSLINGNNAKTKHSSRKCTINCDQVSWLMDIFDRYLPAMSDLGISRERDMLKYGMLYEVMEIANLKFEDDSARWNGTPNDARNYDDE